MHAKQVADRAIMDLPEKAITYVDIACRAIKPEGGVIHFYAFSNTSEPVEMAKRRLTEAVNQTNRRLKKNSAWKNHARAPFTLRLL